MSIYQCVPLQQNQLDNVNNLFLLTLLFQKVYKQHSILMWIMLHLSSCHLTWLLMNALKLYTLVAWQLLSSTTKGNCKKFSTYC